MNDSHPIDADILRGVTPAIADDRSSTPRSTLARLDSIDLLRGIVMVVMMLDHTRDFVHRDVLMGLDPTDLARTNVPLFLTRWITHYCAPVFVFLAGTGIYLRWTRGRSKQEMSKFLLTRGLWLIFLEFTLVRTFIFFHLDYGFLGVAQVIWVIGLSMIMMAVLIYLPLRALAVFGVGMIALHNLLDSVRVTGWQNQHSPVPGVGAKLWILLHQPFEAFPVAGTFPSPVVVVIYPIIPWLGVMAAGYAFGAIYKWDGPRRRRFLITLGTVAIALFIILRLINRYGDPSHWSMQASWAFTVLSFLNTTKYPPSLLFLLMTLGPAMLALAWFESGSPSSASSFAGKVRSFFVTFGRVPLFFYLLQWLTAHLISVALHWATGRPIGWMFSSQTGFTGPPPGMGFSLWVVYACWIAGLLLLYPLCKWFAGVKARRKDWWLSYL